MHPNLIPIILKEQEEKYTENSDMKSEKAKLIIKTNSTKNKIFLTFVFASLGKTLSPYMNSPWDWLCCKTPLNAVSVLPHTIGIPLNCTLYSYLLYM